MYLELPLSFLLWMLLWLERKACLSLDVGVVVGSGGVNGERLAYLCAARCRGITKRSMVVKHLKSRKSGASWMTSHDDHILASSFIA